MPSLRVLLHWVKNREILIPFGMDLVRKVSHGRILDLPLFTADNGCVTKMVHSAAETPVLFAVRGKCGD